MKVYQIAYDLITEFFGTVEGQPMEINQLNYFLAYALCIIALIFIMSLFFSFLSILYNAFNQKEDAKKVIIKHVKSKKF